MLATLFLSALAAASTVVAVVVPNPNPPLPASGTELGLDYKSQGCYAELPNGSGRLFRGDSSAANNMTPNRCLDYCRDKGYPTIGLEYGRECYCSFQPVPANAARSDKCTMRCAGSSGQNCGDPSAFLVYQRDTSMNTRPFNPVQVENKPGWTNNGRCLRDSFQARVMDFQFDADDMSHQKCVDHCAGLQQEIAGIEYGKECFCSTVAKLTAKCYALPVQNRDAVYFSNDCIRACPGNGNQLCGGPDALTILEYTAPA